MDSTSEGRGFTLKRGLTSTACLRGIAAVWLVLALESLVVFSLARREVTSSWELTHGLAALVPLVLPAAALCGVLATCVLMSWARNDSHIASRVLLTVLVGAAMGVSGWSVGGGRHLAALGVRSLFAGILALTGAALTWWAAPRLARWGKRRPRQLAASAWLAIVALEVLNRSVLVRLYPGFHVSLAVAVIALAPLTLWTWNHADRDPSAGKTQRSQKPVWALLVISVLCVALLPAAAPCARALSRFDNFRLILIDGAPLLGQGVKWAARIAPPPPLFDCGAQGWDATCREPGLHVETSAPVASFSLRGRDILMITVDALRADHLGTYGYSRRTSPNIDRLASSAVKFNHAYAPTAHTSYSVTSMMTGKYMRPLLLQGAGADSDTFATLLRRYGYRTAAFYPPAVFFIDPQRFIPFRDSYLGFEYRKVEFLEGPGRVRQVTEYVNGEPSSQRLFVWVHLFGPHEPYEARAGFEFGSHDVDRYDSEIAYADAAIGDITRAFLAKRPGSLVIISADHGEEFGDHGGRYHGSTVYEEQVRVPLLLHAPDLFAPRKVDAPVQTIDLLPTVLAALDVPRPPRVRGRNLMAQILGTAPPAERGLALAESEDQVMLAEGSERLICQRQLGACRLFDVSADPGEQTDISATQGARFQQMRRRERELSASHGQYEAQGLRAEGKGWPNAILRGVAGDADAAEEIASLLDDADSSIRRKAAELLFELNRPSAATALRLALTRDEDPIVRAWCALALTRAGQGAPLVFDLLHGRDVRFSRLAALALADAGDARGVEQLVNWWRDEPARSYQQSRWLLDAFSRLRAKAAVPALIRSLADVRLRPHIAATLAEIGDAAAREPLARAFASERYQNARAAIARALVQLHAREEMARPLLRFLGVPDPIPGGLGLAQQAKILQYVGGPEPKELARLVKNANLGTRFITVIPKTFGGPQRGLRLIVKVANQGSSPGEVRVLPVRGFASESSNNQSLALRNFNTSELAPLVIPVPEKAEGAELHRLVPADFRWGQGSSISIDLLATSGVRVQALAVVPLAEELPPPPPRPWTPDDLDERPDPVASGPPQEATGAAMTSSP